MPVLFGFIIWLTVMIMCDPFSEIPKSPNLGWEKNNTKYDSCLVWYGENGDYKTLMCAIDDTCKIVQKFGTLPITTGSHMSKFKVIILEAQ